MRLAGSVFAARLGADIVLLDARQGQYYCLPDAADMLLASEDGLVVIDQALLGELRRLGLVGAPTTEVGGPMPPVASRDRLPVSPRPPGLRERWDGVATWAAMTRRYYGSTFGKMIDHARRRPPAGAMQPAADALFERVEVFQALLPWAPFPGVCLYRSFMLLLFLRRAGFDATWMFAVRTWPFEAHCWLQVGDVVLDDLAERVQPYTPIMAV